MTDYPTPGRCVPSVVSWVQSVGAVRRPALFASELELVAAATDERRRQFLNGRWCAHQALNELGCRQRPILYRGAGPRWARRAPLWPAGFVGSVTHRSGFQAAAVAGLESVIALGIDAEPNRALPAGVEVLALNGAEMVVARTLGAQRGDIAWDRLIFSAKESVFKARSCLTPEWFAFEDCTIHPSLDGQITVTIRSGGGSFWPLRGRELRGWWSVDEGADYLTTSVWQLAPNTRA